MIVSASSPNSTSRRLTPREFLPANMLIQLEKGPTRYTLTILYVVVFGVPLTCEEMGSNSTTFHPRSSIIRRWVSFAPEVCFSINMRSDFTYLDETTMCTRKNVYYCDIPRCYGTKLTRYESPYSVFTQHVVPRRVENTPYPWRHNSHKLRTFLTHSSYTRYSLPHEPPASIARQSPIMPPSRYN